MKSGESLQTLQAGRGFASLSVVVFHVAGLIALPKYFAENPAPWTVAGDSGVPFFFVLSGLIMVMAHRERPNSVGAAMDFWWRRFRRIYPPLWAALGLAVLGMLLSFGPEWRISSWDAVNALLILPAAHEPLLVVEWTLRHEVVFYLLFGILLANARLGAVLLALFFLAATVGVFVELPFPLRFWTSPYNFLFLIGMATGAILVRPPLPAPLATAGLGAVIFAAAWIARVHELAFMMADASVLIYGAGGALIMIGLVGLERCGRIRVPPVLVLMGDASYSIYLIHFLAAPALTKLAIRIDPIVSLPPVVWFVLISLGSIAAGLVFYIGAERPLLAAVPSRSPFLRRISPPVTSA